MSLGVTIIDKVHQKVLNEGGKKYGILIDDSISDIKTKIFVNTDDFYKETIMYYPNLVRLQIDDSKIMDNSNLSLNYSSIPKKPIVYVTSIFDIIVEKQKYYDFDLEPYKLYMDFKNDNDVIYELYEKLSEEFTDLTQDDFHIIIKMKIFNFNKSSESPIISSDESSNIMKDIKNFFNTIKNEYDTQVQKYKREKDLLTDFYKQVYSYKPGDYYKANESNFIYTTINFTFASKDHDSSISGKFIKLLQIFNLIELSDEIPLVIFNDSPRKDPKIKIYNRLVNTLNESTIRSWILNEKKKLKKETYKKVRGLMFKCKIDLKTSKPQNSYMTVLLNENGVMNVKINFEEEDDQRSFESIKDKLCESIDNLVETLNSLYGVFTQSKRLMRCEDMNWGLVSISSLLETDKKIKKGKKEEAKKPKAPSSKKEDKVKNIKVTKSKVQDYLGASKFHSDLAERTTEPGVVTGLAWTQVGGELLTIESSAIPGNGKVIKTGSLGDVMQESIQAALTFVRSRSEVLGLPEDFHEKTDLHIHVPEGATPKDGPSAGVGMCTSLVSVLTGIPVKADVAMTGEITLRGQVLKIGGLKEKLLAAHRGGIRTVVIPHDNASDLKEIPDNIKADLEICPVKWIDEVLDLALQESPTPMSEEEFNRVASVGKNTESGSRPSTH